MENGFTSQFTKRVMKRPRGRRPTWRMAPKSTFIIMGVIISQIRMAMGMLIWLPSANSRLRSASISPGADRPKATPTTMQRPTHRLRYLSKTPSRLGAARVGEETGAAVFMRDPWPFPSQTPLSSALNRFKADGTMQ